MFTVTLLCAAWVGGACDYEFGSAKVPELAGVECDRDICAGSVAASARDACVHDRIDAVYLEIAAAQNAGASTECVDASLDDDLCVARAEWSACLAGQSPSFVACAPGATRRTDLCPP